MAERQAATVDDWKDVPGDDWKDVTPTAPAPAPKQNVMGRINQFSQEHPRISSVASMMIPGASALLDPTQETGKGALKQLGRDAYGLVTSPAAGPIGMGLGYLGKKTGLTDKVTSVTEPSNAMQDTGAWGTTAAEMVTPLPGIRALPPVQKAGTFLRAAGQAGGRDVAMGAAKMGAGAALSETAIPGPLKYALELPTAYSGAKQIGRGIKAGFQAGREALIPKPPPLPTTPAIYDDIARSLGAKSFESAGPQGQAVIKNLAEKGSTPVRPPITNPQVRPDINAGLNSLRTEVGMKPGQHLGEVPGAHYPERWAGSDSPTIKSTMAKSKFVKVNPEELGIHGGVEGTPIKGPLNTPEKIRIAREMKAELAKSSKGAK